MDESWFSLRNDGTIGVPRFAYKSMKFCKSLLKIKTHKTRQDKIFESVRQDF